MPGLLTDIVLAVGGFQLYLLAAVTLTRRGGRSLPRDLFAAFLITKALLITRWFCYRYEILTVPDHRILYYYSASLFFLLAPFLYLYIRSLCYRDFRVSLPDLSHGLPWLFPVALTAVGLGTVGGTAAIDFVERRYWDLFWGVNLLQILLYILAMVRVVRDYRDELREIYSSVEGIDMKWLLTLLAVIGLHWVFVSSRAALSFFNAGLPRLTALLDLFSITIFLVFTTALAFRGMTRIRAFDGL